MNQSQSNLTYIISMECFFPESTVPKFETYVRHFKSCFTNKFKWVISKVAVITVVTPHYKFILYTMASLDFFLQSYQVKDERKRKKKIVVFSYIMSGI